MTIRIKHTANVLLLLVAIGVTSRLTIRAQRNSALPKSVVTFAEVPARQSGIAWVHTNAHSSDRHLPETVGAGCAFFDYDNDGWMDIYLVNSGRSDFFTPATPLKNALYHNNHDGTFTDVTDKAGKLDLFVSSFVYYDKTLNVLCTDDINRRYYCIPRHYKPSPSHLFHNNGNGAFTDVSEESGIADSPGKSFGVVATDVNNDGRMDLFVANDTMPNFLFVNKGNGKFEEVGLLAGVAYSDAGGPRSGMGVDSTDYDGDGWQDLFVANIDQELF